MPGPLWAEAEERGESAERQRECCSKHAVKPAGFAEGMKNLDGVPNVCYLGPLIGRGQKKCCQGIRSKSGQTTVAPIKAWRGSLAEPPRPLTAAAGKPGKTVFAMPILFV